MNNIHPISQTNNISSHSAQPQNLEVSNQPNTTSYIPPNTQIPQYDAKTQNPPQPPKISIPIPPPAPISIPDQVQLVPRNIYSPTQLHQLQLHQSFDIPVNLKKPSYRKSMWTPTEDQQLLSAVEKYGTNNWCVIANSVKGRTGKQCRERWSGILNPELAKQPWTPEEDNQLKNLHTMFGNKWAIIANQMKGRSTIALRNRWSWHMRHSKRIASVYIINSNVPKQNTINPKIPPAKPEPAKGFDPNTITPIHNQ